MLQLVRSQGGLGGGGSKNGNTLKQPYSAVSTYVLTCEKNGVQYVHSSTE